MKNVLPGKEVSDILFWQRRVAHPGLSLHLHSFLSFLSSFFIFLPLVIVQHVGLMHKQIGSVLQILT